MMLQKVFKIMKSVKIKCGHGAHMLRPANLGVVKKMTGNFQHLIHFIGLII